MSLWETFHSQNTTERLGQSPDLLLPWRLGVLEATPGISGTQHLEVKGTSRADQSP